MPASARPAHLLLIDDDVKLMRLLGSYLHEQGFSVTASHDGPSGLQQAGSERYDLIVLDGMLPRLDGLDVLRRLREKSNVPVLMLTARGDESDRIAGLDGGADDYVPKTVSPRELVSRIRALLRRAAAAPAASREISVGSLRIDLDAHAAALGETALILTPVEFDLLADLAAHCGKTRTRAQLVEGLRDRSFDASDRSIDVHITALRRKLGDDPREPRFLRTVRGVGYLMQRPGTP